jgi:hypothetical protein
MKKLLLFLALTAVFLILWPATTFAVPTFFSDDGDIADTVSAFQAALGDPNNGNALGPLPSGRRQINWDAGIVPFNMPGDFFNNPPPTRGAEFTTPGSGFRVSNDGFDNEFDTFNPSYPDEFTTFSPPRLFTPFESNIVDINFFVPGTSTPATVSGFGAIFADVDLAAVSMIEFFDMSDNLLVKGFAPQSPQGLSFLGATFSEMNLFRVRITTGNTAIGPDDDPAGGVDVVVLDDFLYGEPQAVAAVPEPATLLLVGAGLLGLAGFRRRL